MEAGIKEFIKEYAKIAGISEIEVAMFAGAAGHKSISRLDNYKKFVLTLNDIAPHLIHYLELAGKE